MHTMDKQQNQPRQDMPAKGGQQSQSGQQTKGGQSGQQGTRMPPPSKSGNK
jgi:hypothetical protein